MATLIENPCLVLSDLTLGYSCLLSKRVAARFAFFRKVEKSESGWLAGWLADLFVLPPPRRAGSGDEIDTFLRRATNAEHISRTDERREKLSSKEKIFVQLPLNEVGKVTNYVRICHLDILVSTKCVQHLPKYFKRIFR